MFKILDRYLVREILAPLFLGLLVLTFVLEMPPILDQGEKLIEKGVAWSVVVRVLLTLLPQALGITIPMALLLGILIGFGRLSSDREFVALQACGVSVFRMLRPIALLAVLCCAATAYVMIIALPNANQTFRQITFSVVAPKTEGDVKSRVFFEEFPNRALYVRDVVPKGGWRDVFLADNTHPDQTTVYFANQGRLLVDAEKRTVELLLEQGTRHTTFTNKPEDYEGSSFDRLLLKLDADAVLPRTRLLKGDNEMSIAELRATMAENIKHGISNHSQLFTIQQKFSIPVACLVLALIGLALGVSNRKDGKLASFVLGFGVIFVYYVLLYTSRALAYSGRLSPTFAPWIANIALGAVGVMLVLWRARSADRPIRLSIPTFWRRREDVTEATGDDRAMPQHRGQGLGVIVRVPHVNWPRPSLLDAYVSQQYLRIFGLSLVSLLGILYISTFMDKADKLFRGSATIGMLLRYFYFLAPQYTYYIIPIAALLATLVTIGLLTKNSELIVMRACGISLYRSTVSIVVFAILLSVVLFELQERVVANANREAARLDHLIRGLPVQTFGVLDRRWIIGRSGDIYHHEFFDPHGDQFSRLSILHLNPAAWRLDSLTYASKVVLARQGDDDGEPMLAWQAHQGWTREFTRARRGNTWKNGITYAPFTERRLSLEPPSYFKTDEPEADRMTYGQLKEYIVQLRASGFHVVPYMVQLHRKVAFPFVTLIMTLLAVPFAVTTGRRGALYGIGVGIVLAIGYWTMLSVFGAMGSAELISPILAAWAPNILFGAAAAYMILTVRT